MSPRSSGVMLGRGVPSRNGTDAAEPCRLFEAIGSSCANTPIGALHTARQHARRTVAEEIIRTIPLCLSNIYLFQGACAGVNERCPSACRASCVFSRPAFCRRFERLSPDSESGERYRDELRDSAPHSVVRA